MYANRNMHARDVGLRSNHVVTDLKDFVDLAQAAEWF